jgi:cysteine desulfurase / selenocysteine lyase
VVVTAERALDLRQEFVGVDHPVPVLDGQLVPYVNLDNAASTPALWPVVDAVEEFLPFYASVHRGTGYMSRLSTAGARARRHLRRRRPRP